MKGNFHVGFWSGGGFGNKMADHILIMSLGWRRSKGFGCSPIKMVHELGLERCKTVWFLSFIVKILVKIIDLSTRGSG